MKRWPIINRNSSPNGVASTVLLYESPSNVVLTSKMHQLSQRGAFVTGNDDKCIHSVLLTPYLSPNFDIHVIASPKSTPTNRLNFDGIDLTPCSNLKKLCTEEKSMSMDSNSLNESINNSYTLISSSLAYKFEKSQRMVQMSSPHSATAEKQSEELNALIDLETAPLIEDHNSSLNKDENTDISDITASPNTCSDQSAFSKINLCNKFKSLRFKSENISIAKSSHVLNDISNFQSSPRISENFKRKTIRSGHALDPERRSISTPSICSHAAQESSRLNTITPEYLAEKLSQIELNPLLKETSPIIIVDCRYPYEYEGGHIVSAVNFYNRDQIIEYFFKNVSKNTPKKFLPDDVMTLPFDDYKESCILIFHCEFSSQRAPRLARFLRNYDRNFNRYAYPNVYFKKVFVMEGGYSSFFEKYANFCCPQQYVKMDDERFVKKFRLYSKLSKSWTDDPINKLKVNVHSKKSEKKHENNFLIKV